MSEMVERVAKIIAAEIMELTHVQRQTFNFPDDASGDTVDRAMCAARAAIEAMREPVGEAAEIMKDYNLSAYLGDPYTEFWEKMINAALNEKSPAQP